MHKFVSTGLLAVSLISLPALALAHAGISPKTADNGATVRAVITVPHGCDGAATTDVIVKLPEGFVSAKPMVKAGWNVTITKGAYAKTYSVHGSDVTEGALEVRWSGGNVPDDQIDEFVIQGSVQGFDAEGTLPFLTTQLCGTTASVAWDQVAAPGQDAHALEHPAPVMKVTMAAPADAHHDHAAPATHDHGAMDASVTVGALEISGAFTRATLPGAKVGGGFLTIVNTGGEADRLVSASSPVSAETQLHEMAMEGDVMKMRELENGIDIPAGATVTLQPGGLHVMFMGLNGSLEEGKQVPVTLTFEKAGTVEVMLDIGPAGADAPAHGSMDHGSMDHSSMSHEGTYDQSIAHSDSEAIEGLLKSTFDTPEAPLTVAGIVVSGEYAIAGWAQNNTGGRALLRKGHHGWAVHLCSGAALKDAANLATIGVPAEAAAALAADLATAEASLDAALVAQFDMFDGTMMVDEDLI